MEPEENGEIQISREELLETFMAEAQDILGAMEQDLLALEARPGDGETLHRLFRGAHTLKGSAGLVSLDAITGLSHRVEDLLDRVRSGKLQPGRALVTLLLRSVDVLRHAVAAAAAGEERSPDAAEIGAALERAAAETAPCAPEPISAPGPAPRPAASTRTLRVDVGRLDRMLDLAGEIGIARGRMADMLGRPGVVLEEVTEAHRSTERLHEELQDLIMQARLVPLGPTFRQHRRTVRDLAAAQGKQIDLTLEGEEVEVDTAVVEHIRDPLTHMVRNAVDHGIESPEARLAAGKDPRGRIALRAFHEGSLVVVQVSDDGGGMDRERILRRALERRLVAEDAALSDEQVFALTFEPGFSTRDQVTDLSGRGVGLDVVRRNAEALRGSASISSDPGRGTTVTLRLPLTVAIVDGFRVRVGEDVYVLPLDAVVECVQLPPDAGRGSAGILELRGKPMPFVRLRHHFGCGGEPPVRENVVVVRHAGATLGLAVDALLGESQAVIKPLGRMLRNVKGVSGSTIQGDGRVALILDVAALMREVLSRAGQAA